ncbi:hypothetical protein NKI86_20305 [Mesorhizobium sp. M0320]|uniref:hypothetical protein n=1 Tax=Mesorhizobium sp. M0320 TaxID=2956936 RepID=UPI0033368DD5
MLDWLDAKLTSLDTPAARRREVHCILWDSVALIVGITGLVCSFPPMIFAGALGHVVANLAGAPLKSFWLVTISFSTVIATALTCAGVYLSARYWHEQGAAAAANYVLQSFEQLIATAIVGSGVVSSLVAHPGIADQLREHLDRPAV